MAGGGGEVPLLVQLIHPEARVPARAHAGDVGYDLYSVERAALSLTPTAVSVGLAVKIPDGYYGRIAPRSGMSARGVWVNAGVIDPGYTGELRVMAAHASDERCCAATAATARKFVLPAGTKIAQLILEKVATPPVVVIEAGEVLPATDRGAAGFGSTGDK